MKQCASWAGPVLIVIAFVLGSLLHAQEAPSLSQPLPTYRLQPGDVLAITVQNQPQYSFPSLMVTPDGKISYPLAGEITAQGKTLGEITAILVEALRQELRHPQVTVSIVSAQPQNIYVLGEVQRPGPYDLLAARVESVSVPVAIGMAGGYTAYALRTYVTVIRKGSEPERIPLTAASQQQDAPADPGIRLFPGDTIVVPRISQRVSVLGEVASPGQYELLADDNILTMLSKAKGPTPKADQERALLLRADGTQVQVSLRGLRDGTIRAEDLPRLQDGDVLLFLEGRNDVVVLGEVSNPGTLLIAPQMTVSDALAQAGGPTENADLERVEVVDRQGNKRVVTLTDEKGQLTADRLEGEEVLLKGGETIVVPRLERFVSVLGYVKSPGRVRFQPGDRVADVVALAGGPIAGEARPDQTVLIRPTRQPNQTETVTCDLARVLKGEADPGNLAVKHMDIVYVPGMSEIERRRKDWLRNLLQVSGLLAIWTR